jgi:hypothetical protein
MEAFARQQAPAESWDMIMLKDRLDVYNNILDRASEESHGI